MDNSTYIELANIVEVIKKKTGADKVTVTVRISPDLGMEVTVEPWQPYESDIKKIFDTVVGKR